MPVSFHLPMASPHPHHSLRSSRLLLLTHPLSWCSLISCWSSSFLCFNNFTSRPLKLLELLMLPSSGSMLGRFVETSTRLSSTHLLSTLSFTFKSSFLESTPTSPSLPITSTSFSLTPLLLSSQPRITSSPATFTKSLLCPSLSLSIIKGLELP